ncbi:unnamed protein product, partial [Discosporangium mesarthrocarpum]
GCHNTGRIIAFLRLCVGVTRSSTLNGVCFITRAMEGSNQNIVAMGTSIEGEQGVLLTPLCSLRPESGSKPQVQTQGLDLSSSQVQAQANPR